MVKKEAIKLAIQAIDAECKKLAQQANLYDIYHLEWCKSFSDKRKAYWDAKKILENL